MLITKSELLETIKMTLEGVVSFDEKTQLDVKVGFAFKDNAVVSPSDFVKYLKTIEQMIAPLNENAVVEFMIDFNKMDLGCMSIKSKIESSINEKRQQEKEKIKGEQNGETKSEGKVRKKKIWSKENGVYGVQRKK